MGKSDCLSRRSFLKALGVGAVSLAGARVLAGRSNVVRRPNVLFILADDMGLGKTFEFIASVLILQKKNINLNQPCHITSLEKTEQKI